jgi:hypothetical protein
VLPHGACRDFNVIWNPALAQASVSVAGEGETVSPVSGALAAMLCVTPAGKLSSGGKLAFGDFAIVQAPVTLVAGTALLVNIANTSHP